MYGLGVSHVIGTGLYPSGNSPKIVKSAQRFGIASIPAKDNENRDNVSTYWFQDLFIFLRYLITIFFHELL